MKILSLFVAMCLILGLNALSIFAEENAEKNKKENSATGRIPKENLPDFQGESGIYFIDSDKGVRRLVINCIGVVKDGKMTKFEKPVSQIILFVSLDDPTSKHTPFFFVEDDESKAEMLKDAIRFEVRVTENGAEVKGFNPRKGQVYYKKLPAPAKKNPPPPAKKKLELKPRQIEVV